MADRSSSERHAEAVGLDPSNTTNQVAHHGHSTRIPARPAPAVLSQRHDAADMNERMDAMSDAPSLQDPEKAAAHRPVRRDMAERYNPYFAAYDHQSLGASDDDQLVDQRQFLESKALNVLLFLSGPCALVSGLLCAWSLIVTLALTLTYPFRFFSKTRSPLRDELLSTLARSNRLQLRLIYSSDTQQGRSVISLLVVHLLSPLLSFGVALAAWAVAIYWIFAAMIGDPDGTEGGTDDGRATVLGLRGYWEMWLCRAMT